jgi:DUF3047 family protein
MRSAWKLPANRASGSENVGRNRGALRVSLPLSGPLLKMTGVLGTALLMGAVAGPAPGVFVHPDVACEADGGDRLDAGYGRWTTLLKNRDGMSSSELSLQAESILTELFALDVLSREILGDRWDSMREYQKQQFRASLTAALRGMILPYFSSQNEIPELRPAPEEWSVGEKSVTARYWLVNSEEREWFNVRLSDHEDACGIVDIWKGDRSLLGSLREQVDHMLGDYSFPYMLAALGEREFVVLANFEDEDEGTLPRDWTWKNKDDEKNKPYRVRTEDGNRFLSATDEGESVILGKEIRWDLNEFPFISFRVRVNRIPEGGDERDNQKVDSAAGLYFTLKKKVFGKIPESVKYVWSSTLPVGTAVRRKGIGRPWQVVFGSGEEGLGEWRTYVFDLRQAYRDTFGGDPPSRPVGIGVLSDANSLKLQAYADYDDIRALRSAPAGVTSGVIQIMPPLENR